MRIARLFLVGFAGCVAILSGCGQKADKKQFFMFNGPQQEIQMYQPVANALQVRTFNVIPPYESKGFIYRTGQYRYEADFYNQFMVAPGVMIAEKTRDQLVKSGLFAHAGDGTSIVNYDYVLAGNVHELYGDFTNSAQARANMKIEFILTQRSKPVLVKTYARQCVLPSKDAEGLAAAYSQCLSDILKDLMADIHATKAENKKMKPRISP